MWSDLLGMIKLVACQDFLAWWQSTILSFKMAQTSSNPPSFAPMVGMVISTSCSFNWYSTVVLPAASKPTITILRSCCESRFVWNVVKIVYKQFVWSKGIPSNERFKNLRKHLEKLELSWTDSNMSTLGRTSIVSFEVVKLSRTHPKRSDPMRTTAGRCRPRKIHLQCI